MTPQEVLEFSKKNEAKQLDLRFTDIPSLQHHISYPISELEESSFEDGFGIDGSSIRGWAAINESDMLLIPDSSTAFMDPFAETPTLVMYGDVIDPITKQHYERDPRDHTSGPTCRLPGVRHRVSARRGPGFLRRAPLLRFSSPSALTGNARVVRGGRPPDDPASAFHPDPPARATAAAFATVACRRG